MDTRNNLLELIHCCNRVVTGCNRVVKTKKQIDCTLRPFETLKHLQLDKNCIDQASGCLAAVEQDPSVMKYKPVLPVGQTSFDDIDLSRISKLERSFNNAKHKMDKISHTDLKKLDNKIGEANLIMKQIAFKPSPSGGQQSSRKLVKM